MQESCKLLPILSLQLLDDKANVLRVVSKTIETFSFEVEVVTKKERHPGKRHHTFFTREARLLLLNEVNPNLIAK